ncbi:uncharacterized protein BT62DRAFT_912089 [Guyanagaster necrorhizus]|uniref:C2H2-type domain-containing protein n=1 Tax=Guyanagaster necrorhizus TaxID=856835 RepID=A0A9P7VFA0_9AGAR|nr:uncharacterized protein BT62DRAFT_912089 [Guyanagaster necrorhizus MCA 3950]KAG7439873.1 hypothetical protein BT62DRAFT_912089 [Guyanagaster necrorhizus MCA 3950]
MSSSSSHYKFFYRPSSPKIHINTHTGATPFRYSFPRCGRKLKVNSNMRGHYRNRSNPTAASLFPSGSASLRFPSLHPSSHPYLAGDPEMPSDCQ